MSRDARGRIRSIKPEIWDSEDIGALSIPARLLFIGLITRVDDQGRGRDNAMWLKGQVFAYDANVTPEMVDGWLNEMVDRGMVVRYTVDGKHYLALTGWETNQSVSHPTESRIPAPPEPGVQPPEPPDGQKPSSNGMADIPPDSSGELRNSPEASEIPPPRVRARARSDHDHDHDLLNTCVIEFARPDEPEPSQSPPDGGLSESRKAKPKGERQPDPPGFVEFWKAYPHRDGKPICRKQAVSAWARLSAAKRERVMVAVVNYAKVRGGPGQIAPKDAHRWLTGGYWEDYVEMAGGPTLPDEPQPLGRCEHCRGALIRGHNPDTCFLNPNRVTA